MHHKDEYADHWIGRTPDGSPILVHIAPYTTMSSPARRAEFSRAANAAMAMAPHANLCTALDGGEDESSVLYMIEVLHAELRLSTLLSRALSEGGFPWWAAASLVMDSAKAVEALLLATPRKFSRYAVVEPDDFEVNARGQVKLADAFAFLRQTSSPKVSLYRAPETWFRDRIDERSHVYVLGIWLWEFCSGKHLFLGGSSDAVMARTKAGIVPELHTGPDGVPTELALVIKKALSPSPLDRFERPAELAAALKAILGTRASDVTQFIQTTCADMTHVAGGMRSPQPENHEGVLTPLAASIPLMSEDLISGGSPFSDDTDGHDAARTQLLHTGDFASILAPHRHAPPSSEQPPESSAAAGTMMLQLSPEAEAQIAAKRAQTARPETLPPLSDLTDPLAADVTAPDPLAPPAPESQRTKFAPLETHASQAMPPKPAASAHSLAPAPPTRGGAHAIAPRVPPSLLGAPASASSPTQKGARKGLAARDVILGGIATALALAIGVLLFTGRGKDPDVVVEHNVAPAPGVPVDSATVAPPDAPTVLPPNVQPIAPTHAPTPPLPPQPSVVPPTQGAHNSGGIAKQNSRPEPVTREPVGETGMITIITTPPCKLAVVDGTSVGPCPVVKKKFSAGVHVVKLVGPDGAVKSVALTVEPGRTTVKRETF